MKPASLIPWAETLDLNGYDSTKHIWGPPGTNGGSRTDPFFETNWIKERRQVWANMRRKASATP